MNDRSEQLKKILEGEGEMADAFDIVRMPKNYGEGERFISTILRVDEEIPEIEELLNDALQGFLNSRENRYKEHGYWVHSLSHFTKKLWKRRMVEWIKELNLVAFRGANELGDANCSCRLVGDFGDYAQWYDDPKDFGISLDNLSWMDWEYYTVVKAWIEHGLFDSEEEFLRFKFEQPWKDRWSNAYQGKLPEIGEAEAIIKRLKELGSDTKEFEKQVVEILSSNLKKLEAISRDGKDDYELKILDSEIENTRTSIASICSNSA